MESEALKFVFQIGKRRFANLLVKTNKCYVQFYDAFVEYIATNRHYPCGLKSIRHSLLFTALFKVKYGATEENFSLTRERDCRMIIDFQG